MANRAAPEIVDTSNLTDADWAEINKLRQAYETGGQKAFSKALDELADRDPVEYFTIVAAYFPHAVMEVIEDNTAAGFTEEEFYEIDAANDSPTRH